MGGVGFSFFFYSLAIMMMLERECKLYRNRNRKKGGQQNRKIIFIKRGLLSKRYSLKADPNLVTGLLV